MPTGTASPRSQANRNTGQGQLMTRSFPEVPLAQSPRMNINKLSYRMRCIATPSPEKLQLREKAFVNDGIKTEKSRTKYRDILPKYTAAYDDHCRAYFKRPDVQRLLSVTDPKHMIQIQEVGGDE